MSVWNNVKVKVLNLKMRHSNDPKYLRNQELIKLEEMPIYYTRRHCLWERQIKDRYNSHKSIINYSFDFSLERIGLCILKEKEPERLQELVNLYKETEEMKEDYHLRNGDWKRFAMSLYDKTNYIGATDLQKLCVLEEKYAKYNGGRGLAAFKKAIEKYDKILDEIIIQKEAESIRIKNEQRLKEILNSDNRQPFDERFEVNRNDEKINSEKEERVDNDHRIRKSGILEELKGLR